MISAPRSRRGARWSGPTCFDRVVLMSAPFAGRPSLPFDTANEPATTARRRSRCTASSPRCRGRASITNGTTRRARPTPTCIARRRACTISCAPTTTTRAPTGKTTSRYPLQAGSAGELAKMPTYYIMDLATSMAATVAKEMPSAAEIAANRWLPDSELARLQRRICAHRLPGRPAMVPLRTSGTFESGIADLVGPHHRRAVDLHLGQERLGHLPDAPALFETMQKSLHAT